MKRVGIEFINGIMGRKCYVKTCSNTYRKTKNICVIDEKNCTLTAITYHSFPRQPYLRQKWIEATGRSNWVPSNGSYICSEHFRESDYDMVKHKLAENDDQLAQVKRILKKTAIPTQQLAKVVKLGDLNVYSNENNVGSSDTESASSSTFGNQLTFPVANSTVLNNVKEEPKSPEELMDDQQHLPIITSTVTVKEENDHSDRLNGQFESQLSPINHSNWNNLESRCDYSYLDQRPKRLKHQDSLIAPEDIKVERSASPLSFNCNLNIEEKYERLLDEFLKLKRDYDLLKFKYDIQRDAINKCEQILSGCR